MRGVSLFITYFCVHDLKETQNLLRRNTYPPTYKMMSGAFSSSKATFSCLDLVYNEERKYKALGKNFRPYTLANLLIIMFPRRLCLLCLLT